MIALSSFRPLDESEEYRVNQLAAFESWNDAFEHIVFFNQPDKRMTSDITTFVGDGDWPRIKDMAEFASRLDNHWACIVNADIYVSPDIMFAETGLRAAAAKCATSHRYEFERLNPVRPKQVVDNGLDFFAGTTEYWKRIASTIPDQYRIGTNCWDTWMIAASNTYFTNSFFDLTPTKVIFHPKHGGRRQKYRVDETLPPFPLTNFNLPARQIV